MPLYSWSTRRLKNPPFTLPHQAGRRDVVSNRLTIVAELRRVLIEPGCSLEAEERKSSPWTPYDIVERTPLSSEVRPMSDRSYDVVVYGATGFVGRLVVQYFAASPSASRLRWAIAGRDKARLEAVRNGAGPGAQMAAVLIADARDGNAVDALVRQSRIVLNTAGPFALHGDLIVGACVRRGTHYVDIAGETPWIRRQIQCHHETAMKNWTRIVPSCGFDSVPSDLGAYLMVRDIQQKLESNCRSVAAYFRMYGGINGGTIASGMQGYETGELVSRTGAFSLNPTGSFTDAEERAASDVQHSRYDREIEAWVGPFFMAPVNTRIVRRSAALYAEFGQSYGGAFSYHEYLKYEPPFGWLKSWTVTKGMALFEAILDRPRARAVLKRVLPRPGEGPSEKAIRDGWFKCELVASAENGQRVRGLIAHDGDPSNSATTQFVSEAALSLSLDGDRLPGGASRGGVLTPATALGEPYVARIRDAGTCVEIGI
jgi:short subunit dehydrogenase-like uncharacterized protein